MQNVLFLFISMKYSNAFNSVKSIGGFNVKLELSKEKFYYKGKCIQQ